MMSGKKGYKKSVEENRRLSESIGKRNRSQLFDDTGRAKLLLEINNAVVSTLDLRGLLETVSTCLKQIINHDFAVLFLYAADTVRALLCACRISTKI